MVPVLGLGLLKFAIVQATNVSMVYCIDCYRPAVGEVSVSILAFKGKLPLSIWVHVSQNHC